MLVFGVVGEYVAEHVVEQPRLVSQPRPPKLVVGHRVAAAVSHD